MSAILASGNRNDWSNNDILNNNRTVEKVTQYVHKLYRWHSTVLFSETASEK